MEGGSEVGMEREWEDFMYKNMKRVSVKHIECLKKNSAVLLRMVSSPGRMQCEGVRGVSFRLFYHGVEEQHCGMQKSRLGK